MRRGTRMKLLALRNILRVLSLPCVSHEPDVRLSAYPLHECGDLFISPYVGAVGPEAAIRIHLPHNQPAKFACHPKESFQRFHAHFIIGPLHREQAEFTIAHYRLTDPPLLCDVGYPKSDKLLS